MQLSDRTVDVVRQVVVHRDGTTTSLTTREAELLAYLARRPEQDVTRDELLTEVWAYRASYATRAVDVAMRRLRAKVEPNPRQPVHLISIHGVGYRFVPPPKRRRAQPAPPTTGPRTNLRPDRSGFVGRVQDLQALGELFDGGARLVTIVGTGGIGKTRVATRFGAERVDTLSGGVWLCDVTEARSLDGVLDAVGAALNVPLTGSDTGAELATTLGKALRARGPTLLIIDNFEQVVDVARASVGRWLTLAPELLLLVTSRERLRLQGEHVYDLPPLPAAEARDLFVERARAVGATVEGDERVDRIVARLDGLPLAIELAAPRARALSLEQLHDRLDRRFRVLASKRAGASDRQATMRGAIDWSWELLTPHEASALAQCSVFSGGFTMEAAEAVVALEGDDAPWTMDVIAALRDKSLLRVKAMADSGDLRLGMYESIRAYAAEQLGEGRPAAESRHATWVLDTCSDLAEGVEGVEGVETLRALAQERENLLAVYHRRRTEAPDEALRAILALQPVLFARGPYNLYSELLGAGIALAEGLGEGGEARQRLAQLLVDRAKLDRIRGKLDRARADVGRAFPLVVETGSLTEIDALMVIALVNSDQARLDESEAFTRQALEVCKGRTEPSYERIRGVLVGMLGAFAFMRGNMGDAERLFAEAIEQHRVAGNVVREALDSSNLGLLLADLGRIDEAERYITSAVQTYRAMENGRRIGTTLMNLGGLRIRQWRLDDAAACFSEALQLFREIGYLRFLAVALINLASMHFGRGDCERAIELLVEALDTEHDVGDPLAEGMARAMLAAVLATRGELVRAEDTLDRARQGLQGIYSAQAQGLTEVVAGFVAMGRARTAGSADEAAGWLMAAQEVARETEDHPSTGTWFSARILKEQIEAFSRS